MVFERFSHPRLAGLALVGFGWWVIGLFLGLFGPDSLGFLSSVMHLLGLVTLVVCGIAYGLLWWGDYFRTRFDL